MDVYIICMPQYLRAVEVHSSETSDANTPSMRSQLMLKCRALAWIGCCPSFEKIYIVPI